MGHRERNTHVARKDDITRTGSAVSELNMILGLDNL